MSQKGNSGRDLLQVGRDYVRYIKVSILSGHWGSAVIALVPVLLCLYGIKMVGEKVLEASGIELPKPAEVTSSPLLPDQSTATQSPLGSTLPVQNSNQEKLLGAWYSEGVCSASNVEMIYKGTTEYFRDGNSNYIGEIALSQELSNRYDMEVIYSVASSGEWKLNGDRLVEKISDLKSYPKIVKLDGIEVDQSRIRDFPLLENFIPEGISSEVMILELNNTRMKIKVLTGPCQGTSEYIKQSS